MRNLLWHNFKAYNLARRNGNMDAKVSEAGLHVGLDHRYTTQPWFHDLHNQCRLAPLYLQNSVPLVRAFEFLLLTKLFNNIKSAADMVQVVFCFKDYLNVNSFSGLFFCVRIDLYKLICLSIRPCECTFVCLI